MSGESLAQFEAELARARGEVVDVRPWAFGVHVIRRQRADATPVVDARPHEQLELGRVGQIRGHLDARIRTHNHARHGDGRDVVDEFGIGRVRHGGSRLRAKVLHDHLLHVAVPFMGCADRLERVRTVAQCLADTNEDARGERNACAPGILEHLQPYARLLIGRAIVHLTLLAPEPLGRRLEHHSHGRREGAKKLHLFSAHHPGIQVRHQAGLGAHGERHVGEVVHRRRVAVGSQPVARRGPAILRAVAQRE